VQPDPDSVRAQHAHVVAALETKLPAAAAHLDEARDDILAFTASPVWFSGLFRRIPSEVRCVGSAFLDGSRSGSPLDLQVKHAPGKYQEYGALE
jgi:hypothetical protein